MKFFAVILFTIATVATVTLAKNSENSVDMKLMNFLSRSSNSMQENPQRSLKCFEYYVPLLNEIGLKYEEGYKECLSSAEAAIVAAEKDTAPQREKLAQDSSAACAAVSACNSDEESSAEAIFQCYVKSSSDSSRTLHGVSTQATVELATLQENIRRIKSNEGACVTKNKIEYEQKSTATYDDFNDCIMGISDVPETTVPTEGPEEFIKTKVLETDMLRLIKNMKNGKKHTKL